jgi:O-antigen/teichoic acid export membrane protein
LWRGSPRWWLAQTRQLSGWFTATALIGQTQTLAVNFLVTGQLSKSALTGLRTAQMALLQPVQNFQLAVQGLLVPRLSQLAGDAEGKPASPAAVSFRRRVSRIALAFAGLAVVTVAVLWPTATLALTRIEKFADIAPLALPISLQSGIYLAQVPITAAMRAMHQARLLFVQYLVFTATSLTGLVIGAASGGLTGAGWGLVTGSATGFLVMLGCYRYAVVRLTR